MKINAAIQLLPLTAIKDKHSVIDDAIAMIKDSGLHFEVCPFETAVEGDADAVYALIRRIQDKTLESSCSELLINVKIHAAKKDVALSDKTGKYR